MNTIRPLAMSPVSGDATNSKCPKLHMFNRNQKVDSTQQKIRAIASYCSAASAIHVMHGLSWTILDPAFAMP